MMNREEPKMVNAEELKVLHTLEDTGGTAPIELLKRLVAPYSPEGIEQIVTSLSRAGFLELTRYGGRARLTEKGAQALGKRGK